MALPADLPRTPNPVSQLPIMYLSNTVAILH